MATTAKKPVKKAPNKRQQLGERIKTNVIERMQKSYTFQESMATLGSKMQETGDKFALYQFLDILFGDDKEQVVAMFDDDPTQIENFAMELVTEIQQQGK
jgi:type VI protein secretion system component VasK